MSDVLQTNKLNIKSWAEEDRPREKMLSKGRLSLTDAELIAILIASGSKNETAVDLSKRILADNQNSLNELSKLSVDQLMTYPGIGEAKALAIVSALELGRRRRGEYQNEKAKITSSRDAYEIIKSQFLDLPHEEFWVIYLNRQNKYIAKQLISKGGVAGTLADARLIYKPAIEKLASYIILAHNHPSGNLSPSEADIALTKKMKEAGKLLDVQVIDHIIVTDNGFYSFADEQKL
jgi:DNA repair protein RadC